MSQKFAFLSRLRHWHPASGIRHPASGIRKAINYNISNETVCQVPSGLGADRNGFYAPPFGVARLQAPLIAYCFTANNYWKNFSHKGIKARRGRGTLKSRLNLHALKILTTRGRRGALLVRPNFCASVPLCEIFFNLIKN